MKLTLKEMGALDILLSSVSLSELIEAARIGFQDDKELELLCTFILSSLNN